MWNRKVYICIPLDIGFKLPGSRGEREMQEVFLREREIVFPGFFIYWVLYNSRLSDVLLTNSFGIFVAVECTQPFFFNLTSKLKE